MGVFTRPDSPVFHIFNEVTKKKTRTDIRVDAPTKELRKQNLELATALWQKAVTAANADKVAAVLNPEAAAAAAKPARATITFDAYVDWYDPNVTELHEGREREREILQTLRNAFGTLLLTDVTIDRVIEWRAARRKGHAASTVVRELGVLKQILRSAVPRYIEIAPFDLRDANGRKLWKDERPAEKVRAILAPGDDDRLLAAIYNVRDKALVTLAIDTLIRLKHLLALQRKDDLGTHVRVARSKKGSVYQVPLSTRARQALDLALAEVPAGRDEYIFGHRRTAKTEATWRRVVRQIIQRACDRCDPAIPYGLADGLTFHGFRHTGATRIARVASLKTLKQIGDWRDDRMVLKYQHPDENDLLRAVESIAPPPAAPKKGKKSLRLVKGRKRVA